MDILIKTNKAFGSGKYRPFCFWYGKAVPTSGGVEYSTFE